jgi:hypothetical protein
VQLLGLPFNEQKLITIGAAYEAATHARIAPPAFGPVAQTAITARTSTVGGTVPATLSLAIGSGTLGAFTAGVARDYTTTLAADVVSTAGDAALSVSDPSAGSPGHLVNGAFALASPLQLGVAALAPLGATPLLLHSLSGPSSHDPLQVKVAQHVGAADPLRTGDYRKTLTFTLSTATP